MSNNIDIKFTVDEVAAFRAWQRQQAQLAKVKTKLDEAKKAGDTFGASIGRAMKDAQKSIRNTAVEIGGVISGWLAVSRGVEAVRQSYDKLQAKTRDLGVSFDEAFRKFNIQANLQGIQADQYQRKIEAVAVKMAMDPIEMAGIAEQLVSSGYSKEEAAGPALEETAKLMVGTNQAMTARGEGAVSTKDLVSAMSAFMDNMGMGKTGDSVKQFGVVVQTAFKETNLQLEDMASIAGEAAVFRGKMTPNQVVAMGSILKDTNPSGPENATAMRNITSRMSGVIEPDRVEMLGKMKLKPADIDMVGEDIYTALKRLRVGIESLPEDQRFGAAKKLFEERGMAPFMTMMQPGRIEEMQSRDKRFADEAQYEADIRTGTSGKSAQARRLKGQEDIRIAREGQKSTSFDETLSAARAEHIAQGNSEVSADLRSQVASWLKFTNTYSPIYVPGAEDADYAAAAFTTFSGPRGSNAMPEFSKAVKQRTEAAASPYGQLPEAQGARDAINEARKAAEGIEAGSGISSDEARGKVQAAADKVRSGQAQGSLSDETVRQLMGEIFRLSQVIEAQIKSNDKNTAATEQLAANPAGGGAASGIQQRPRNGQNARMLTKGSPLVGGAG